MTIDRLSGEGRSTWGFLVELRRVRSDKVDNQVFSLAFVLIPYAENAIVDVRKLRGYCLNFDHNDGKHKARLFLSILGMTADNAEELCQILLEVVKLHDVTLGRLDQFGQRYTLDFAIEWHNRNGILQSGWVIEHGSEIPKLTTCYPL